eukprot:6956091-Alexandrium_andersonii.AAC.1
MRFASAATTVAAKTRRALEGLTEVDWGPTRALASSATQKRRGRIKRLWHGSLWDPHLVAKFSADEDKCPLCGKPSGLRHIIWRCECLSD